MHSLIRAFPSEYFYGSSLLDSDIIQRETRSQQRAAVPRRGLEAGEEAEASEEHTVKDQRLATCFALNLSLPGNLISSSAAVIPPSMLATIPQEIQSYIKKLQPLQPFRPLNFLDLPCEESKRKSSFCNVIEAAFCALLAVRLHNDLSLTGRTIAIITPYSMQKNLIAGHLGSLFSERIEVNTVDGFQGREKDIVIFSCVRTGHGGNIGFLSDERRLNVAITRAKGCLIIVGNSQLAAKDRKGHWSALLAFIQTRQAHVRVV
jgi:superfamily I DNA and/or RNA helicase